jgi:dipeptidyl aminopeptidase/acylaminoacyl peptidase
MRSLVLLALFAPAAWTQSKPLVTPKDLGKWEQLGQARLSADGNWIAYAITRGNEENELRLRDAKDTTIALPYATAATFTADSRWLGYLVGVAPKERDKLLKDKKPVHTSFAVRNLATGETISIPDASSFSVSPAGSYIAVARYAVEGKRVNDVIVLDLAKGARLSFSNVNESAWSEAKPSFAFAVASEGGASNALNVYDAAGGVIKVLESSASVYRAIAWRPKSDDIAAMRTVVVKEFADTAHALLVWSGAAGTARSLDGAATGIPAGTRIADYRRPTWSQDGRTIYFGVRNREAVADQPKKSDEKISDVEIWHTNDVHVIPEQRAAEQRDLRATSLVAWHMDGKRVVPVASDAAETVTVLKGDTYATETNHKPYAWGQKFGRRDEDVAVVNLATGERSTLITKARFFFTGDPTGKRVAQFDGTNWWVIEVATGVRRNLTAALKTDFVDRDDDHPSDVLPPIGAPSWSKDGTALLVNSNYDVWSLGVAGTAAKRLTDGAADGIQHRLVNFGGFGATVQERAVDLSKPVYFTLYGKRSKKSGYALRKADGPVQQLILADASITSLAKADSAQRYVFVKQSFADSPNVFAAGPDLTNATQLSHTNAFQKEYAWGKAELMDFTSTIGRPLQAILYYPVNYGSNKKYPMIVYTYELLSQGLHRYVTPRENDYYNATVLTQNGYFVLMPDIVFRPREPGIAVLQAVEPAVQKVIARGLVDPARIGHAGHSQGGYEAYYLATHSKLFATAVAGAGISDMVSFAGQMHWSSVPEFDHWETGQFRMQVPPWEDWAAMIKNSPIDKVNVMPAKSMLIEIGGDDPTVDMRQGVEFYNYARRAGKDAVMLLYPGEGHGLGKRENAIDYERRILQWFAYYLKGEAPAKWITDGQKWTERKAILDANK